MLGKIHSHFEAWLILVAAKILMGRNLGRSMVTSRADNEAMWYMGEKLQSIADRIKNDYPGFEAVEHRVQADGSGVLVDYDHHTKPLSTRKLRGTFRRR